MENRILRDNPESALHLSSSSGAGQEGGWERGSEIPLEKLRTIFSLDEIKMAQDRTSQRHRTMENDLQRRCSELVKETKELLENTLGTLSNNIRHIHEYINQMPSNPDPGKLLEANRKLSESNNLKQAYNRVFRMYNTNEEMINQPYQQMKSEYPQNQWHHLLDRLDYPCKDNHVKFTNRDRELLIERIIALIGIKNDFYHEARICLVNKDIGYANAFGYSRHLFATMDDFSKAYNAQDELKVNQKEYQTKWQNIANEEFFEALQRAQNYAESLLERQEEAWGQWFKNPFLTE